MPAYNYRGVFYPLYNIPYLDSSPSTYSSSVDDMLCAWLKQSKRLESGEISKEEYDEWRYKYPKLDKSHHCAKVYPQELFDFLDECAEETAKEEKKEAKRKKKK